jgi:hypothetical protein
LTNELRRLPKSGFAHLPRPHASWRGEPWTTIRAAIDAWRGWLDLHRERPHDKLVRSLARHVIRAERDGRPFRMFGREGIWRRRHELPKALASLTQQRLQSCGRLAVASGKLRHITARRPRCDHGRLGAP